MPVQFGEISVIHRLTAPGMGAEGKAARLDYMHRHAQTGSQPQNRPDIGCDVRLKQCQAALYIIALAYRPGVLQKALRLARDAARCPLDHGASYG